MPNRLAAEPSLYLRQHAENPVDWYPWGPEALAEAQRRDVPLLVSIGYSACHWCHVMAHESFASETIARLMNARFVCVKIDREERPDVDAVYMEAVQMMNQGHGGWPLNLFCLPDGRPFAGGTYFPPEDRDNGLVPWPTLLLRVAEAYTRQKEDLLENAAAITQNLTAANAPNVPPGSRLDGPTLLQAAGKLLEEHDDDNGGFGAAPKFPLAMALGFLLDLRRSRAVEDNDRLARRIDFVLRASLENMVRRGLFDQVGGGFFRYCVDAAWAIPHFEKMLYDNALLLDLYAKAHLRDPTPLTKAAIEETVAWLEREMTTGNGFAAALDADSGEGEGAFYTWTPDHLREALGEAATAFARDHGVTREGNFEHGTTHLAFQGAAAERSRWDDARGQLLAVRQQRPAPGRDDKTLLSWNAWMVRGLATAAFALNRPAWRQRAREILTHLDQNFRRPDGSLGHVAYGEEVREAGLLEDYAALAEAHLAVAEQSDAHEPGTAAAHVTRAAELAAQALEHFRDPDAAGFFTTAADGENVLPRKKDWFDNATPSGQSSLLHVCTALHALTGEARWREPVDATRPLYGGMAPQVANGLGHALSAFTQDAIGIVVVKARPRDGEDLSSTSYRERLSSFAAALRKRPWRRCFLQATTDPAQPAGFQVCVGPQCLPATEDPEAAAALI